MADEKFKKWSERYKKGEIPNLAMPPLPAGPAGTLGRQSVSLGLTGLRALREAYTKSQKAPKGGSKGSSKSGGRPPNKETPKTRGGTGTLTDKLGATRTRPRTEKESNKFGPLVKRQENLPAKQSRALVKREENLPAVRGSREVAVAREGKRDLEVIRPGNRSVATQKPRTFGDKGQTGRITGMSRNGKLAMGAAIGGGALAAAAGYKRSQTSNAAEKGDRQTLSNAPRDDRASSNTPKTDKQKKAAEFRAKQQGRKVKGSPTYSGGTPKKAEDKSRAAKKPLTNFERMKARQYEKEGYGGRSMTSSKAKSRVEKERSYKFKDLFKKK